MKFCRGFIYELNKGVLERYYVYIILFLACGVLFFDFYQRVTLEANISWEESGVTSMNLFLYLLQGKLPFHPESEATFQLPVMWLLPFLYSSFLTLNYPYRNFTGYDLQRMLYGASRSLWWYSKCLWLLVSTTIYFLTFYLSLLFYCMVFGMKISMEYEPYINEYLLQGELGEISERQLFLMVFFLPVIVSLGINYFQFFMGLFWDRIFCYLLSAILLFSSAYYSSCFFTGNFAMIKRSIFYTTDGFTVWQGITINIGVILLSILFGNIRVRRINLVRRIN